MRNELRSDVMKVLYEQGYTYQQIADVFHITPSAVCYNVNDKFQMGKKAYNKGYYAGKKAASKNS